MNIRIMVYKTYRYIGRLFCKAREKYLNWKTCEHLKECAVQMDCYDDYMIAPTAIFHATAKLRIGSGLIMGEHSVIDTNDSYGIYIGNNLLLADHVYIRGGNHDWSYSTEPFQNRGHLAKKINYDGEDWSIVIEDNVWCGHGATIISGAHVGEGTVIGAGAVVGGVIPPYSVVVGNPYQIVSNREKHLDWDNREDIGLFP